MTPEQIKEAAKALFVSKLSEIVLDADDALTFSDDANTREDIIDALDTIIQNLIAEYSV